MKRALVFVLASPLMVPGFLTAWIIFSFQLGMELGALTTEKVADWADE